MTHYEYMLARDIGYERRKKRIGEISHRSKEISKRYRKALDDCKTMIDGRKGANKRFLCRISILGILALILGFFLTGGCL